MLQLYDRATMAVGEIPFGIDRRQVVYIDNGAPHPLNHFVRENLSELNAIFWKAGLQFCYFSSSMLYGTEGLDEQILYRVPWLGTAEDRQKIDRLKSVTVHEIRNALAGNSAQENVFYAGDSEKFIMKVDVNDERHYMAQFQLIASEYSQSLRSLFDEESGEDFGEELEMRSFYVQLARKKPRGIVREALERAIRMEDPVISRIVIRRNGDVLLPDYNQRVHLRPKEVALFVLFLRHPEGIALKDLVDYRDELTGIYEQFSVNGNRDDIARTIAYLLEDYNDRNVQLSRIKRAFEIAVDEEIARNYCITGRAGDVRRITLPRDKVEYSTTRGGVLL